MSELLAITIAIVFMFMAYCMGQSRMRRKCDNDKLNMLAEIRRKNSDHEPLDEWLTEEINPLMKMMLEGKI